MMYFEIEPIVKAMAAEMLPIVKGMEIVPAEEVHAAAQAFVTNARVNCNAEILQYLIDEIRPQLDRNEFPVTRDILAEARMINRG